MWKQILDRTDCGSVYSCKIEALLLTILDLGNFLSNFSYDLLTKKKELSS